MRLKPHHFNAESKPKKEDFEDKYFIEATNRGEKPEDVKSFQGTEYYQKVLREWEAKYIKPEPNWMKFYIEKTPEEGQKIYWTNHEIENITINETIFSYENTYYSNDVWVDKEDYDTRLAYWQKHQVLFEGWEEEQSSIVDAKRFFKDDAMVTFYEGNFYQLMNHGSRVYQGKCSVELFKLICKENEIEI